jgi:choline dehydrogenase-like flavoprotein
MFTASVSSTGREYPLKKPLRDAWNQINVRSIADGNDGTPVGISELVENRRNGLRQLSCNAYGQDGVTILTNTVVKKVLTKSSNGQVTATGVEIANGTKFKTAQEVIISAGAYRSAQVLLLSGIGPKDELKKHGIKQVIDSPHVGEGLRNHLALTQFWKLSNPEAHQAIGSPNPLFLEPQFNTGLPADWVTLITADNNSTVRGNETSKADRRTYIEAIMLYQAANAANPVIPSDGSHVMTFVFDLRPTSAGTLRLNSTDPTDFPLLDLAYYSTERDRSALRTGIRTLAKALLETPAGKSFISSETVANGFKPILPNSADSEIDARVRAFAT